MINIGHEDNIIQNLSANIKEVFKNYHFDEIGLRLRDIYEEDIDTPLDRTVAIDIDSHQSLRADRAHGGLKQQNYILTINVNIWYYHEELNDNVRKKDVINILWGINHMFMKHTTINGFVPQFGCEVISSEYMPRRRGSKIMAGGMVRLKVVKLYKVTNVD